MTGKFEGQKLNFISRINKRANMKTLDQWLVEYSVSHQHPTNKQIHNICVPLIMFSVLGLVWSIPTPELFQNSMLLNWSVFFSTICMIFYFSLGISTGLLMLAFLVPMLVGVYALDSFGLSVLWISVVVFVVSWVGQFIGHKIEGKKPSFFQDIQFLLIGPLWVFRKVVS